MYNFFPDGFEPGEDDALFGWIFVITQIGFQAMPYVFGLRHFFTWEVEKPILWFFIGSGLSIVTTSGILAIISLARWILDVRADKNQ